MKNAKTLLAAGAIAVSAMTPAFAGGPVIVPSEPVVIVEDEASTLGSGAILLILLGVGAVAWALSENNNNGGATN